MYRSLLVNYKFIEIYSDGCLQINNKNLNNLDRKKVFLFKKDYKLFKMLYKKKLFVKKINNYRTKIF